MICRDPLGPSPPLVPPAPLLRPPAAGFLRGLPPPEPPGHFTHLSPLLCFCGGGALRGGLLSHLGAVCQLQTRLEVRFPWK